MKIVVLEQSRIGSDVSFDCLHKFGETVVYDATDSPEEAAKRLKDADIAIVDQFSMNEASLYKAQNLKLITMSSTGTNFVDFSYTNRRGIAVANIKDYSTHSVAQHTFSMLLYLYEKLPYFDRYVRSGDYVEDSLNRSFETHFHELNGKTWGIAGLGKIGSRVAAIAQAFGCDVLVYSPSGHTYESEHRQVSFDELLRESDVLSIHTPLTSVTENLFTYEVFQKMKRTAYFINVARGAIVNEADLARALNEHLIAGAGLDVLSAEPMQKGSKLAGLMQNENLFITPHIGWASVESRQKAVEEIYLNIEAFLKGCPRNICR
jgi:Lactate dehydrogenase and related dehydrogenases